MKILVCGGRDYTDAETLCTVLDEMLSGLFEGESMAIIHGNCKGADKLSGEWAKIRGIPVITVDANWDYYNKSAGHIRNYWMLKFCEPDLVIAFPGGRGTAGMVEKAHSAEVKVVEVTEEEGV